MRTMSSACQLSPTKTQGRCMENSEEFKHFAMDLEFFNPTD